MIAHVVVGQVILDQIQENGYLENIVGNRCLT
jgi:hypothetical protein